MSKATEKYGHCRFVEVACPLCASERNSFEREIDGFRLVKCAGCTLVFVNPQLHPEDLGNVYRVKHNVEELIEIYARLATPTVLAGYDYQLERLEELLGRKGRILDFACAAGYFVERAARRGWDSHGADIASWAKEAAARRGVENIHVGELADLDFPDHHFDVVNAAQVLEHLQSPLGVLSEIQRVLRPDGILYVDVPNYRTLPIMLGKDRFFLNSPPQHINFFTPKTLRQLLTLAGFKVIEISTNGGINWENLFNRPIVSEIADAYRAPVATAGGTESGFEESRSSALRRLARSLAAPVVYDWMKVGINLAAFLRPPAFASV